MFMKRFKISPWLVGLLIVALVLVAWFTINRFSPKDNISVTVTGQGETLAKQYCASCHLFPEPQLLDKKTWQDGVLPNMAMRLGIRMPGQDPFAGMDTAEIHLVRNRVFITKPKNLRTRSEFCEIINRKWLPRIFSINLWL